MSNSKNDSVERLDLQTLTINSQNSKKSMSDHSSNSTSFSQSNVDANELGILFFSNIQETSTIDRETNETVSLRDSEDRNVLAPDTLKDPKLTPMIADGNSKTTGRQFESKTKLKEERNFSTRSSRSSTVDSSDSKTTNFGQNIEKGHQNFVLMYDMLTGIRHAVSVCQAKNSRPLTEKDFTHARTYNFLDRCNSTTPSKYEFRFKDYSPWVFRNLREAFKIDAADYLVSLTGKYALSEIGSQGKSGSFFYFSQDFRYIIKTIRKSEHEFLRKILKNYTAHILKNPNSLLSRFYGLHRVRMSNIKKIYFVVMGNIFTPHKDIHETFDLKGATFGRYVTEQECAEREYLVTLKDLNWLKRERKLKLGSEKATFLMNQMKADCLFLSKMNIMDYSLLVGIHFLERGNFDNVRGKTLKIYEPDIDGKSPKSKGDSGNSKNSSVKQKPSFKASSFKSSLSPDFDNRKMCMFYQEEGGLLSADHQEIYFMGIIDILTPYNLSKRIENCYKSIRHNSKTISAVNPKDYYKRFVSFMSSNILQDSSANYSSKNLPSIPIGYHSIADTNNDDLVVIEGDDDSENLELKSANNST